MGSLGMPEILMILVVALIVFGPRKLPELGKSLGQSLAQFRRASEDFKRQWEDEVDLERRRIEAPPASAVEQSSVDEVAASTGAEVDATGLEEQTPDLETSEAAPTVHRDETVTAEPKRDWL
ncbi:MAG: twin-arginine translocase TatA/TatE family subunit [Blastocatellia bacterium]